MEPLEMLKELVEYYGKGRTCDLIVLGQVQVDNYLSGRAPVGKRSEKIIQIEWEKLARKKKA